MTHRILPIVLLALPAVLAGQTDSLRADSLPPRALAELVVSATRSATPRFSVAESVVSVPMAGAVSRTSPEALAAVPGVLVQKTNHGGGSPFLRGLTGNQTLLLLDGVRLNNATFRYGPNQYFNTLDVFSLERIEVLRGSGSVQYGSDALGGVIQAFTRQAGFSEKPQWGGRLLLRGASAGMEQSARADLQYSRSRTAVSGGFTWRNFGDLLGGDTTGFQRPSGYRETDFDLKARFLWKKNTQLTLAHQQVHQQHVPVFHKIQLENFGINEMDPQRRTLSYARLEQTLQRGSWKNLQATISFQQTEEGRNSQKNGATVLRRELDRVQALGLNVQVEQQYRRWSANSGLEWYHDAVRSRRTDTDLSTQTASDKRGLYPDGAQLHSAALYSLHRLDWSGWQLSGGARWNFFRISVADETIGEATLRPSALVGSAALLRRLGTKQNVFVRVHSAFRAPNIDDLGTLGIVDFRYETPNFNLRPERSWQVQAGHRWQSERWQTETYLYRNELRDLIARIRQDTQTVQGYPLYRKENVEKVYIQGFETQARYRISAAWSVEGSLSGCYGQNLTQREPARRIPPLMGRLALQYTPRRWSFGAEWLAAGKQDRLAQGDKDDNRIPAGGTPAWNVLNLHAGYSGRRINLRLSALNLSNRDYRTHGSGVNGYGRSVFVTAAWTM